LSDIACCRHSIIAVNKYDAKSLQRIRKPQILYGKAPPKEHRHVVR